jgi:hypothetical protein
MKWPGYSRIPNAIYKMAVVFSSIRAMIIRYSGEGDGTCAEARVGDVDDHFDEVQE